MKQEGAPLTPEAIRQKMNAEMATVKRNLYDLQKLHFVDKQGNKIWTLKGTSSCNIYW